MASFVVPLCIKLRHDPLFCASFVVALIALFKSYPVLGDNIFWLSGILPLQRKLFKFQRTPFININVLLFTLVLSPVFHFIWIYAGSGNANFFYALTLLWGLANVLLLGDLLYGWTRRTYEIYIRSHEDVSWLRGLMVLLK